MALEFIDGFDHNASRKWDTSVGSPYLTTGRFGGYASHLTNNPFSLTQGQLAPLATRVVGFALMLESTSLSAQPFFHLMDDLTAQLSFQVAPDGKLQVLRGATVLATSTHALFVSTWVYFEVLATIHPSSGSCQVNVWGAGANSGAWINFTGNTQNTGNSTMDGLILPSSSFSVDDFYCLNTLGGGANTSFLGECRIHTNMPNGDGLLSAWDPSSGSTHFNLVNEIGPDGDTSYVSTLFAGAVDLYTFPNVTTTGVIAAIQVNLCARKDDAGVREIAARYLNFDASSGGVGGTSMLPESQYAIFRQIWETDPASGIAYTDGTLNGAQFGVACVI